MVINSKEDQTQNRQDGSKIEPRLHNADKLIHISGQAKTLASVMLFFSIVALIPAIIFFYFILGDSFDLFNFFYNWNYLLAPLAGLALYLLLRFINEGILLLIDIEIDVRELRERAE